MPRGLRRLHQSGQSHFITFSCYRRQANFTEGRVYDLFLLCVEAMRRRFCTRIYGYVVMPEHVHLLLSEPEQGNLAEAMHYLKLSFSKRVKSQLGVVPQFRVPQLDANLGSPTNESAPFWQKRYYDRNVRGAREFGVKLRYLHRNPGPPASPVLACWGGIR